MRNVLSDKDKYTKYLQDLKDKNSDIKAWAIPEDRKVKRLETDAKNVHDYIQDNKIDKDIALSRRVQIILDPQNPKDNFFTNLRVGDVYQDKSFTSASLIELTHFGTFNIKILCKKGSNVANGYNKIEFEYIINKGSKFKVIETKENGITVELL